jgi:hypothetical protein
MALSIVTADESTHYQDSGTKLEVILIIYSSFVSIQSLSKQIQLDIHGCFNNKDVAFRIVLVSI